MYLTEDEAKQKWCPKARTVEGYTSSTTQPRNRVVIKMDTPEQQSVSDRLVGCQCIASACMAWRWGLVRPSTAQTLGGTPITQHRSKKGYCGAFGYPNESTGVFSDD